jgi:hypothetical protein
MIYVCLYCGNTFEWERESSDLLFCPECGAATAPQYRVIGVRTHEALETYSTCPNAPICGLTGGYRPVCEKKGVHRECVSSLFRAHEAILLRLQNIEVLLKPAPRKRGRKAGEKG